VPVLQNRVVLEVIRGIRAFVVLEAGVTRGPVPDGSTRAEARARRARESLSEKDRKLQSARQREATKDRRIATLKASRTKSSGQDRGKFSKDGRGSLDARRKDLSSRYLQGSGIEIGALNRPLPLPPGATVTYVDRHPTEDLRSRYPSADTPNLVEVDALDDGEELSNTGDGSADFVIANHMIEHCQNPIATLGNHLRVLKEGGILYMAVPNKQYTFDVDRPVTSLDHLTRDYTDGPEGSYTGHLEEWSRLVTGVPEEKVASQVERLRQEERSIHFHVFTPESFLSLLIHCQSELGLPLTIESFERSAKEFICIIRKSTNGNI
jgi:SAM-dependent methyltransferase